MESEDNTYIHHYQHAWKNLKVLCKGIKTTENLRKKMKPPKNYQNTEESAGEDLLKTITNN